MRLEDLQPGMCLAKDVFDPNGTVLIRAGAPVTERLIKALKSWGIGDVPTQVGAQSEASAPRSPNASSEMTALLDTQFSLSNRDHPVIQALYAICLERALGKC